MYKGAFWDKNSFQKFQHLHKDELQHTFHKTITFIEFFHQTLITFVVEVTIKVFRQCSGLIGLGNDWKVFEEKENFWFYWYVGGAKLYIQWISYTNRGAGSIWIWNLQFSFWYLDWDFKFLIFTETQVDHMVGMIKMIPIIMLVKNSDYKTMCVWNKLFASFILSGSACMHYFWFWKRLKKSNILEEIRFIKILSIFNLSCWRQCRERMKKEMSTIHLQQNCTS